MVWLICIKCAFYDLWGNDFTNANTCIYWRVWLLILLEWLQIIKDNLPNLDIIWVCWNVSLIGNANEHDILSCLMRSSNWSSSWLIWSILVNELYLGDFSILLWLSYWLSLRLLKLHSKEVIVFSTSKTCYAKLYFWMMSELSSFRSSHD